MTGRGREPRPSGGALALLGAMVTGAVIGIAVRGAPAPAESRPPPVSTATVIRTDLATTVLTGGTLGYAPTSPLINRVAGTYTALPPVGTRIEAGQTLYRVGQPSGCVDDRGPAGVAGLRAGHERRARRGPTRVEPDRPR